MDNSNMLKRTSTGMGIFPELEEKAKKQSAPVADIGEIKCTKYIS